jgi:hypothetical protein
MTHPRRQSESVTQRKRDRGATCEFSSIEENTHATVTHVLKQAYKHSSSMGIVAKGEIDNTAASGSRRTPSVIGLATHIELIVLSIDRR